MGIRVLILRALAFLTFCVHIPAAQAQGIIVSSTAAWSSQIVAFWGAVGIGARCSTGLKVGNPVTSLWSTVTILRRTTRVLDALTEGSFAYLSAGYMGSKTRIDVVLISWKDEAELRQFALRLCTLLEGVALQKWGILVVGRKLTDPSATSCLHWTQCPRQSGGSTVRLTDTGALLPTLSDEAISAIAQLLPPTSENADMIALVMRRQAVYPATRTALVVEVSSDISSTTTPARHFTSWDDPTTRSPFVNLSRTVASLGQGRCLRADATHHLYLLVHVVVAVAVAVGLMAAATGRGLGVWLFSVRLVIAQLGGTSYAGDEVFFLLLGYDAAQLTMLTDEGSWIVAGDLMLAPMAPSTLWHVIAMNVAELAVIIGGWVYGSLHTQKLAPVGLVGHGMLWLATVVGLALSLRAFMGVRARLAQNLIGKFAHGAGIYHVLPEDFTLRTGRRSKPETETQRNGNVEATGTSAVAGGQPNTLTLLACLLQHASDDSDALLAALQLIRRPAFCADVEQHALEQVFQFEYSGDLYRSRGARPVPAARPKMLSPGSSASFVKTEVAKESTAVPAPSSPARIPMSTYTVYPHWFLGFCVLIVAIGACLSATYAYVPGAPLHSRRVVGAPVYSKMLVEVTVSAAIVAFATADRVSRLPHLQSAYMSFMVAGMVVSSVWYVGVSDVG